MRIVYLTRQFNRSGFSVLDALIRSRVCEIAAVVLPPLRPSQRSMARLDNPAAAWLERGVYRLACARQGARPLRFEGSIKRLAERADLAVDTIPSLKEPSGWERLAGYGPDLLVLGGGWPELLPAEVFALAPLGAINTHPSLLPAYRGTDVHRWQILDGVRETGTTIHYIDHRFDTGAVIAQQSVRVKHADTPQKLFQRTADVAGPLMVEALEAISATAPERIEGRQQAEVDRPSFPKWPWADDRFLRIDPERSAAEVERFVRACTQESFVYDGPWFELAGRQFIVRRAARAPSSVRADPGTLTSQEGTPVLHCSDGAIALERLQERAPVPMRTRSFGGPRFARRYLPAGRTASVLRDADAAPPSSSAERRLHSQCGSADGSSQHPSDDV